MTTQRDRLAAVLHETWRETHDNNWTFDEWADALLARGVRVVDVDTLAAALHRSVYGDEAMDELARRLYTEDAENVLDALDGRDLYDEDAEHRFLEPIGIDRDGMASIMRNLKR